MSTAPPEGWDAAGFPSGSKEGAERFKDFARGEATKELLDGIISRKTQASQKKHTSPSHSFKAAALSHLFCL